VHPELFGGRLYLYLSVVTQGGEECGLSLLGC
jgi:hypothetical protein